ncbi:MAG TPA: CarD family transcriptional regulator [Polyangiales bacterium]
MAKSGGAFRVGDRAVYPAHGVAEVVAIESKEIAGSRKDFYVLKVIHSEMKLMIPCDGADRAGLRGVASPEIAAEVFAVLSSGEIAVKPGPWNRRFREYSELVNSGRLVEVAKVYRDLWRIRPTRELSYGERRLLDHSRNLLVAELSIARNLSAAELEAELETAVLPAAVPDAGVPDADV